MSLWAKCFVISGAIPKVDTTLVGGELTSFLENRLIAPTHSLLLSSEKPSESDETEYCPLPTIPIEVEPTGYILRVAPRMMPIAERR